MPCLCSTAKVGMELWSVLISRRKKPGERERVSHRLEKKKSLFFVLKRVSSSSSCNEVYFTHLHSLKMSMALVVLHEDKSPLPLFFFGAEVFFYVGDTLMRTGDNTAVAAAAAVAAAVAARPFTLSSSCWSCCRGIQFPLFFPPFLLCFVHRMQVILFRQTPLKNRAGKKNII